MVRTLGLGCLLLLCFGGLAQVPVSDIYLVPFNPAGSMLEVDKAVNITQRAGYDNQPYFLPDGSLLYTSIREDNQADIYHYQPHNQKTTQITNTPESEYSPTLMPDGKHFSVIRVEANNDQRLWQFQLDGSQPKVVLETVKGIGYHAWLTPKRLGVFIVAQPMSLQLVNVGEEKPVVALENIGRCLSVIPGTQSISIVHKKGPQDWELVSVDGQTGKVKPLRATLPGSEDYAWKPNGTLIMAQGRSVYRSTPLTEAAWQPLAEFDGEAFRQINRLAISPDGRMLAMVVAK